MAKIGPCQFFSIPHELRDRIYTLVLQVNNSKEQELLSASPPSKALLLACPQLHAEAEELYNTTYRTFWTTTNFTLTFYTLRGMIYYRDLLKWPRVDSPDLSNELTSFFAHAREEDVANIRNFQIQQHCGYPSSGGGALRQANLTFEPDSGTWRATSPTHDLDCCNIFIPGNDANATVLEQAGIQFVFTGETNKFLVVGSNDSCFPNQRGQWYVDEAKRVTSKRNKLSKDEIKAVIEWLTGWSGPESETVGIARSDITDHRDR